MIGNFLFGALVGGVTVAGGLVAASLISPVLQHGKPSGAAGDPRPVVTVAPEAALPVGPGQAPVAGAKTELDAGVVTQGPVASLQAEPEVQPMTPVAQPVGEPVGEPVGQPVGQPVEAAPDLTMLTDAAPPRQPEATAPEPVPAMADVPVPAVPQEPARPPAPEADAVIVAVEAPAPQALALAPEMLAPEMLAPEMLAPEMLAPEVLQPVAPPVSPALGPLPQVDPLPGTGNTEPAPAAPGPVEAGETELAEGPGDAAPAMPGTPAEDFADEGTAAPDAPPMPDAAVMPAPADLPGPTLKPAPGLRDRAAGVIVNRLPRIGAAPASDIPAETPTETDPASAGLADDRPIVQNAAVFDNPDGKPLFSVVLIDGGDATLDREALAALPFPVSFALDPLDPASRSHAMIYRAAGKEVVMLATGIAQGAQAGDIEVAFQTMEQGLPEAVAVMDLPEKQFQDNRPLASLVVPVIAAQGRGLLTWDQGLNAADQVARRADLAAAVVFRPIDAAGEDRTAIRRTLDRAAFKSAQDGRVTVVGRTSAETVAALLEWTVEGRAATVALAPLSAVLTSD